ncbi:hypothetical protein B0H13DRAFT_1888481 [Mycena leptocephala]|nr:hypothetical protein B0H13DRAFT_1888481 [Mycena leptocephala]
MRTEALVCYTKAEGDRWEQYDEDSMDGSGAVQIAWNSGSTMQTAKAEPILEGRGVEVISWEDRGQPKDDDTKKGYTGGNAELIWGDTRMQRWRADVEARPSLEQQCVGNHGGDDSEEEYREAVEEEVNGFLSQRQELCQRCHHQYRETERGFMLVMQRIGMEEWPWRQCRWKMTIGEAAAEEEVCSGDQRSGGEVQGQECLGGRPEAIEHGCARFASQTVAAIENDAWSSPHLRTGDVTGQVDAPAERQINPKIGTGSYSQLKGYTFACNLGVQFEKLEKTNPNIFEESQTYISARGT